MSYVRLYKSLFERAGCILRQNAYFIHTEDLFPSVLITVRSKQNLMRPLIRQLTRKTDFYLPDQLQKFRLNLANQEHLHAQTNELTDNKIYGLKFDQQSQFLVRPQGSESLELRKEISKDDEVYGVVLFKGVSNSKINFVFGNLNQVNYFFIKIFVILNCFYLCNNIMLKTRYENHSLVKQKK